MKSNECISIWPLSFATIADVCVLLHMNAITMKIGVLLKKKQKQKQQQKNGDCTHDKTPKQFFRTTEHSS